MADDTKPQTGEASGKQEAFAQTIAKAVAQATLEVQGKIRPIEESRPSKTSVFNPDGGKRPRLTRNVIFCGHMEDERSLTNEEIDLYNRLQPGRYHNRKWEVILREDPAGEKDTIQIRIPVAGQDDRMDLYINGGSLKSIAGKIIAEAEAKQKASA